MANAHPHYYKGPVVNLQYACPVSSEDDGIEQASPGIVQSWFE